MKHINEYNYFISNDDVDNINLKESKAYKKIWSKEKCQEEALKYKTRYDLFLNNRSAYDFASKNDWLDNFYGEKDTKSVGYWTKERCQEEALRYKSRVDFRIGSGSAYMKCHGNNWLDEVCSHMIMKNHPKGYWTKEKCQEEALKYKSRHEFEAGSRSAYVKSNKMGWMDEICSHMIVVGNKHKRCIYAVEFSDNHVYIGLSYNYENRFRNHIKDVIHNKSSVLLHIKESGIIPKIKQITDYIDVNEASKLEEIIKKDYEKNGWAILNKIKCGSIGGNSITIWTKEKCQEEALKYDNKKDFLRDSSACCVSAYKNKWMDEICSHMTLKSRNKKGYWTKEKCQEEALKYKSRWEFEKKSPSAYGSARRNGWRDDICSHMKIKKSQENI